VVASLYNRILLFLISQIFYVMIRLYKTKKAIYFETNNTFYRHPETSWDDLINIDNLYRHLSATITEPVSENEVNELKKNILAPVGSQEVWASGVTYLRSRDARMEESENAKTAYDRVYEAERPELFFKSAPHRVAGPGEEVYIRTDSTWNVPEPELTLFINNKKEIAGYTIGNDMSSRSIEGENTLYLPQAKTYERSAALGPCLLITDTPISPETGIDLKIYRENKCVFHGQTKLNTMKRKLTDLKDYLMRALRFEHGCFLMTGTGIVPDSSFTLEAGDECHIAIDGIGTLVNKVSWL
jgi:2-dehydro-3-deoxy-D-arabinonate dehydratase